MPESIKLNCMECGEIEVDYHFERDDGQYILAPIGLFPEKQNVIDLYEGMTEENIENFDLYQMKAVGVSHLSYDDDGKEEADKHILGSFQAWFLEVKG